MVKYICMIINLLSLMKHYQAVHVSDVSYFLYVHSSPEKSIQLIEGMNNTSEIDSKSDAIIYFVHGWTENYRSSDWYGRLKNAFLSKSDKIYNVIEVDWEKPANLKYIQSAYSTRDVGKILGQHIAELTKSLHFPLSKVHIVGHSLGSHVAGFAGQEVRDMAGERIGRITALDPAGPLFILSPDKDRLNRNDADVVVVLHTDGGKFGYLPPCGTIDIFANTGHAPQPGCPFIFPTASKSRDPLFCSHGRSREYYIEAVRDGGFYASKCHSFIGYILGMCSNHEKIDIGGDVSPEQTGNYYFKTHSGEPYKVVEDGNEVVGEEEDIFNRLPEM